MSPLSPREWEEREAAEERAEDERERWFGDMPRIFGNPAKTEVPWLESTDSEEDDE